MPFQPREAYKKQIQKIYNCVVRSHNDTGDTIIMILREGDVTIDGSFLESDDALDILHEIRDGWSWHWGNAIDVDEDGEVHL